jgi:hypothetical protein
MAKVQLSYNPKDAKRTIEIVGVTGPTCEPVLDKIEQIVGGAAGGQRVRKDEFFGDAHLNTQHETEGETHGQSHQG